MQLEPILFLNGLLSLIFVITSTYVGIRIASKYIKYKQTNLILVGFSWIGISSLWIAPSISFILVIMTGRGLTPFLYFFIANAFIPLYVFIWMIVVTEFLQKENQKIILIICAIIGTIVEIFFFYFLFTAPSIIGELQGPLDTKWGLFMVVYYILVIIIMLITGTLFARASFKSPDPEIKLKGKFLMAAFYTWGIGCLLDTISSLSIIILIMARIILVLSAIQFYWGFFLPNFIKKIFLNKNSIK